MDDRYDLDDEYKDHANQGLLPDQPETDTCDCCGCDIYVRYEPRAGWLVCWLCYTENRCV